MTLILLTLILENSQIKNLGQVACATSSRLCGQGPKNLVSCWFSAGLQQRRIFFGSSQKFDPIWVPKRIARTQAGDSSRVPDQAQIPTIFCGPMNSSTPTSQRDGPAMPSPTGLPMNDEVILINAINYYPQPQKMTLTSSPEVVPPEDSEAGSDLMAAAQRAADAARGRGEIWPSVYGSFVRGP